MKHQLIMTKGLPASGKTTWAREQLKHRPDLFRVNKDDIRAMLFEPRAWNQQTEKLVVDVRDQIIKQVLASRDRSVVVDDTNLAPKHESALRHLALIYGAEFEVKDFSHVSLETCLERDADRDRKYRVGRKVIMDMYDKYLYKKPTPPEYVIGASSVVICDLDGTIAERVDRGPFDTNVENDRPRFEVIDVVKALGSRVFFVSGRKEEARNSTKVWLCRHEILRDGDRLFMRADNDNRRDSIVKREIYEREIAGKYNVIAVFDDRPAVIRECWRPLGLPVFDVGDGRDF